MNAVKPSSLRRKITAIILLISFSVLLVAAAVLASYELVSSRRNVLRNLAMTAEITASNTTAALMYQDRQVAYEVLAALRADPYIELAVLYDAAREPFVSFTPNAAVASNALLRSADGAEVSGGRAVIQRSVEQGGTRVGTLLIVKSLGGVYHRMTIFAWVLAGVLIIGAAFAVALSALMQRRISDPILVLARLATRVSQNKDYSARAANGGTDEIGELTQAFNAMLDEIERSHTALLAREAQLALVTDNSSVSLAHLDREHRFKFVNQTYARRFKRKPRDLIGVHLSSIIGEKLYAASIPHIREVLQGRRVEFELAAPFQEGEGWAHIVYVPEIGRGGEVLGFVAVVTDLTARKRIEQEVERARDEALAASRAKDDFLAALSHELRTPLSPVLLLASEGANNPSLPDTVRTEFNLIRKSVELEARLIDDLLDLTRITRGKLILDRSEFDLADALLETITILNGEISQKGVQVVTDFRITPAIVHGDPVRLRQVFWNVISNAVKFSSRGGRIVVALLPQPGPLNLLIRITDDGIGMTPKELSVVFDAFAQGEHAQSTGSHRFGGLGLGLAISRSLVELHGGVISASSAGRGKGTTITIELLTMAASTASSPSRPPSVVAEAPAQMETSPGSCRLLLVDDHGPTRATLQQLLGRRGYNVLPAGSVAEALALADQGTIDLVVSDIGLPDGDGCMLMQAVKKKWPQVRGIALSGYGADEDIARSRAAGFSAHLTKPVNTALLDRRIAEVRAETLAAARHES